MLLGEAVVFKHFLMDFATLLSVMNPFAVIPIYVNLTSEFEAVERLRILKRAIVVSFSILIAFLVVGEPFLAALGVTLDAFRIAGGVVLLLLGMRMIFDEGGRAEPPHAPGATSRDIAVFPLAMPMISGSGAILAIILLTENDLHRIDEQAATALTMCLVLAINYVVLRFSNPIYHLMGPTGVAVVGRVSGLIVAAIAVQVMITGLHQVFPALGAPSVNSSRAPAPSKSG